MTTEIYYNYKGDTISPPLLDSANITVDKKYTNNKDITVILGAGPTGLLTALLLDFNKFTNILLIDTRRDYTRNQIVFVNPYTIHTIFDSIKKNKTLLISNILSASCSQVLPPFPKYPICYDIKKINRLLTDNTGINGNMTFTKLQECVNNSSDINKKTFCTNLIKYYGLTNTGLKDIDYTLYPIFAITISKLEELLFEHIVTNYNANIAVVKPDAVDSKLNVSINPKNGHIFINSISPNNNITYNGAGYNSIKIKPNNLIGCEGNSSIIRKYMICPSTTTPPGSPLYTNCFQKYKDDRKELTYGTYFIIKDTTFNSNSNTFIQDFTDIDIKFNNIPTDDYRIFRTKNNTKNGKMSCDIYIGIRINEASVNVIRQYSHIFSQENNKCSGNEGIICKFRDNKTKESFFSLLPIDMKTRLIHIFEHFFKVRYVSSIEDDKVRTSESKKSFEELYTEDKIEDLKLHEPIIGDITNFEKYIAHNIKEFAMFETTPKIINQHVISKSTPIFTAIAGDSVMNVHYFSGTGINNGFDYAHRLVTEMNKMQSPSSICVNYNYFHTQKKSILEHSTAIAYKPLHAGSYYKQYVTNKKKYNIL